MEFNIFSEQMHEQVEYNVNLFFLTEEMLTNIFYYSRKN